MIKFKEQKQTNSYVNNITNEEINLKIHEMLLDFYKRFMKCYQIFIKDVIRIYLICGNQYKKELIKGYLHTLKNIFMINK